MAGRIEGLAHRADLDEPLGREDRAQLADRHAEAFGDGAAVGLLRGGLEGPFTEEADGRVSNQIRIKITNRRSEAMQYTVTLDGLTQAGLRPDEITIVAPENPLKVDAGATRTTSLFVLLPRTGFANGERMITISVTDGRRYQESVNYRLLGPVGNAPTGKFR